MESAPSWDQTKGWVYCQCRVVVVSSCRWVGLAGSPQSVRLGRLRRSIGLTVSRPLKRLWPESSQKFMKFLKLLETVIPHVFVSSRPFWEDRFVGPFLSPRARMGEHINSDNRRIKELGPTRKLQRRALGRLPTRVIYVPRVTKQRGRVQEGSQPTPHRTGGMQSLGQSL